MKKTIVISVAALLLFILSLLVTLQHIRGQVMEQAVITTQKFNNRVSLSLESRLLDGKRAAYSILSGYFCSIIDSTKDHKSSQEILNNSRFRVSDADRKLLTEEELYHTLEDFLRVNTYCFSAIFFLEPDAFPNLKQKYRAPAVYRDFKEGEPLTIKEYENKDLARVDLRERVPFERGHFYQDALLPDYKTIWRQNSWANESNGYMVSYYVPIIREDGKSLGVFCMSFPLMDHVKFSLQNGLPYQDSYMEIYGEKGALFLSTIPADKDLIGYLRFETALKSNDWKIVTYISEKQVYEAATYVQKILWAMSILSVIFVSIAAASISRFLRKRLKQEAAMASELKLASKTQMDILNPAHCEKDKYNLDAVLVPAKDVGGDLYDYYLYKAKNENEHSLLYFIIGDVSGKGMPAALMMTQVCSLFRDVVRFKHTPEEILSRINDVLAERNDMMMFCTAFIGSIDLETYEMKYANAGHDKPVIIPSASDGQPNLDGAYYLEMKPNAPLAIMEGRTYKECTLQLQKGSQIVVYTDGVTESMSKTKVQFGEANLLKALKEDRPLLEAVKIHAYGAEQSDDITILKISLNS